jgi:acetylornithine/succinyldiaminopimelate/putrescine aminotransferase
MTDAFTENPVLGHITTFGGHPVCCAAGLAAMKVLLEEKITISIKVNEELFRSLLVHPKIKAIRSFGLWMALEFESFETNKKIIDACIENGIMTDWFLFAPNCLRISPPLIVSENHITEACNKILDAIS